MKRAVSISIGSSRRDKVVEIQILGETVRLERIGTDGDLEKAARLYQELDGKVDALGVGGGILGLMVDQQWYPMHSLMPVVRHVRQTPLVDGTGLKLTLERRAMHEMERQIGHLIPDKKAFIVNGVERWGMITGAQEAGYRCVFGDLLFTVGLPIPLYRAQTLQRAASALIPLMSRLPFHWLYPIGKSQESRNPKFTQYFKDASVIMGDCHYIWRYMPERMDGKVIVTNTTTLEDQDTFRKSGVRFLVTTTPIYNGRSFGTNAMEAAIVAAAGRKEPVEYAHPNGYFEWMNQMLDELCLKAQIQEL